MTRNLQEILGTAFDCDGVFVDSTATSPDRFCLAAERMGLVITPRVMAEKAIIPRMGKDAINYFWPEADADAVYVEWEKVDVEYPFEPIPGTREALEELRAMHLISSVLSNRGMRTLTPLLRKLGIAHLMNAVWGCEGFVTKPNPDSALAILKFYERLNIRPSQLLFVGDSVESDWPVARDNGMRFLGVLTGVTSDREFREAGVPARNIVCSIAEVPEWIRQNDPK
jgi:phosphoglycolate phosphatase-like HAD superfamily hydrolase